MQQNLMSFNYHHPHDLDMILEIQPQTRTRERIVEYPSQDDLRVMLAVPEVQQRAKIYTTQGGLPVGYTIVDHFHNLIMDFAPGFLNYILGEQIVQWGLQVLQRTNTSTTEECTLDAVCREDDLTRIAIFEKSGFSRQSLFTLKYERDLRQHIPEPKLPPGMIIRPLNGPGEVPAVVSLHRAAFNTNMMTEAERMATLSLPGYDPRLDLVVQMDDGHLAGYCTGMINQQENEITGRLVGYTDPVAVRPGFQRQGLATALLLTSMRLLKQKGMEIAVLGTSSENTAMNAAAEKLGYKIAQKQVWFSRIVPKAEAFQPRTGFEGSSMRSGALNNPGLK